MGAIVESIKNALGNESAIKQAEEQINAMSELAEAKADLYEKTIKEELINAGTGTNMDIPIKRIIRSSRETKAYSKDSADKVPGTVTDSINDFIAGGSDNVMKGVGKLLTSLVTALFNNTSSSQVQKSLYTVLSEGNSIIRLDVKGWKRSIKIEGLTDSNRLISAFVIFKSTVNVQSLDFNTFSALFQQNLHFKGDDKLTEKEIAKEMEAIEETFKKFKELDKSSRYEPLIRPTAAELRMAESVVEAAEARAFPYGGDLLKIS